MIKWVWIWFCRKVRAILGRHTDTHTLAELASNLEPGFCHIEIQWRPTGMWMYTRLISIVVNLGIQALSAILKSSAVMNETFNEVWSLKQILCIQLPAAIYYNSPSIWPNRPSSPIHRSLLKTPVMMSNHKIFKINLRLPEILW